MSPPLLSGVLEREAYGKTATPGTRDADRLLDSAVADRIAVLGQLSDFEINTLWSHAKLKSDREFLAPDRHSAATGVMAALIPPQTVDRSTRIHVNRSAQGKMDVN
jgi:hypothetical protein